MANLDYQSIKKAQTEKTKAKKAKAKANKGKQNEHVEDDLVPPPPIRHVASKRKNRGPSQHEAAAKRPKVESVSSSTPSPTESHCLSFCER